MVPVPHPDPNGALFAPAHELHDWIYMGLLAAAFLGAELVSRLRHRRWKRAVMSAFR
jgi:hypothetical protein